MSALLLLVPVSLALAGLSVCACLFAIRGGQFDDLESPRWRLLFDSDSVPKPAFDPETETARTREPRT